MMRIYRVRRCDWPEAERSRSFVDWLFVRLLKVCLTWFDWMTSAVTSSAQSASCAQSAAHKGQALVQTHRDSLLDGWILFGGQMALLPHIYLIVSTVTTTPSVRRIEMQGPVGNGSEMARKLLGTASGA